MTQTPSNNFDMKISSQLFIQQLDTLIIQLTKVLAIEHGIKPDPEAKEMVRRILLNRAHSLMSEASEAFVKEHIKDVRNTITSSREEDSAIADFEYEFIKLLGLDHE